MNQILPAYDVHPITLKMLKKGHPWIIKDKFTEKFHPRERFVVAREKRRPIALMIHDPRHDRVKARLWSSKGDFATQIKNFKKDLAQRIQAALTKRKQKDFLKERQNIYLVFGEADQLPGVHVQLLGGELLVQFYSFFWDQYADYFIEQLLKSANKIFGKDLHKANVWLQKRSDGEGKKTKAKSLDPNCSFRSVEVDEYGVTYLVELGKHYDCGLYTDMSSVRSYLKEDFKNSKRVLNLYSYTGAFSLFALKNDAQKVVSVDLSETYLGLLENNIDLNPKLDKSKHHSICSSSKDALDNLIQQKEEFDLVISDPPSSSSDGQKRSNALQNYEKELPKMAKLLARDGKLCIFLNTRRVPRTKFEKKILEIIETNKLGLKIEKRLMLSGDCPNLKGFPEGSYLKGLVLSSTNL